MKYYQTYIKTDCSFCKKALDILEEHDKMVVVTILDRAPEEVIGGLKSELNHETVPIVLEIDTERGVRKIGGYTELKGELDIRDAKFIKRPKWENLTDEEKQAEEDYWHNHGQGD